MVRTIRKSASEESEQFYNALASSYDRMTGFEKRFKKERPFFKAIVDQFDLTSALDAGCGTGFHSILLSQLGVTVTGVDRARGMLRRMKQHAREYGISVRTMTSSFPGLRYIHQKEFDSVFCLGNTFAHLRTVKEVRESLQGFYHILNDNGVLILQILNYDRILRSRTSLQSVKEDHGTFFIRFYEYGKTQVVFHVMTIRNTPRPPVCSIHSVHLRAWKAKEIVRIVKQTGFYDVSLFGSIALDSYRRMKSTDIVLIARKQKYR